MNQISASFPLSKRIIARLDIKGPNLIKGVHLEGLRVIGDPQVFATKYYEEGADELIYIDSVASLYGRNNLREIVARTAENVFIPMTVGGGIRSVSDVRELLRCGADKVAINTAAVHNPNLLRELAETFGSQCVVLSLEAKRVGSGGGRREGWEVRVDCGRERTGKDAVEWVKEACALGVGEILVTSIDQDGTRKGFDVELVRAVSQVATVPVIASGGLGTIQHGVDVLNVGGADALAIGSALHYKVLTLVDIKDSLRERGFAVRRVGGRS